MLENEPHFSGFSQTKPFVFHADTWGQVLPDDFANALIALAFHNPEKKARLCLHPSSSEITQVTFLALAAPYRDKWHFHPERPEIMIPIQGEADLSFLNEHTNQVTQVSMKQFVPISIEKKQIHSLHVIGDSFLFMEIGNGPFTANSTIFPELNN